MKGIQGELRMNNYKINPISWQWEKCQNITKTEILTKENYFILYIYDKTHSKYIIFNSWRNRNNLFLKEAYAMKKYFETITGAIGFPG
jgi:hypothetical protein